MAKIRVNGYTQEFSGRVGPHVFTRRRDGMMVASIRPDRSHLTPTPAQEMAQQRFKQVVDRAKVMADDPTHAARYAATAELKKQSVFATIVADLFTFPFVDEVNLEAYHRQIGDTIGIATEGRTPVIAVTVKIVQPNPDPAGAELVLESGPAVRTGEDWVYTATSNPAPGQALRILVTAVDALGHQTTEA